MTKQNTPAKHHHGNLRQALVTAGTELLAEGGLTALTLRKCAARAGVSHAAPAHHFKGLKGLVTAIVAQAHLRFTETMIAARNRAEPTPEDQLLGICQGYLEFFRDNVALAELMFRLEEIDTSDPVFSRYSSDSYQVLAETCAPFKASSGKPREVEIQIWSLVQGYATLERAGLLGEAEISLGDILPILELKQP